MGCLVLRSCGATLTTLLASYGKFLSTKKCRYPTSCQQFFPTCTTSGLLAATKCARLSPIGKPSKQIYGPGVQTNRQLRLKDQPLTLRPSTTLYERSRSRRLHGSTILMLVVFSLLQ